MLYTSKHWSTRTHVSSLAWMTCDMCHVSSPLPFTDNLVSPLPGSWKFMFDLANKARSLVEILQRHKTHDQKLLFFGCLYVYKDVGSLLQYIFICCIRCDWRCVSACLMSVSAPPVVIMDTGDRGFYYDLSVLRCQPLPLPLQTHSQPTTIMLH